VTSQLDNWPHTRRALPWLIAVFIGMIFLFPFDSATLPLTSGLFELKLDRLLVLVMAGVWLAAMAAGKSGAPQLRRSPINLALGIFLLLAIASVLLNLQLLANADELSLALKKLILLGSYIVFFFIVASSIRPAEAPAFMKYALGLSLITAAGVVYEYRSGTNVFWSVTNSIIPGNPLPPSKSAIFDATGRRGITGPTAHGLAVTTLLSMTLPLALMSVMRAKERKAQIIRAAMVALLLGGSVATVRKSAAIVPIVGFIVLAIYRPRAMLRLSPLFAVLLVVVHFMAPGAMGSIKSQLFPKTGFYNSPSVQGRTADFAAVKPDLEHRPLLGRGYGTYDPARYRLLDNQYLGLRIADGWLGYASYIALLIAVAFVAHRVIRSGDPTRAGPALTALSAAAALAAASKLFDALAFPQVPYMFLFLAGIAVALSVQPATSRQPAPVPPEPQPQPPRGRFAREPALSPR
jgi:polysaccharide biosynthesis protein PslJ